ncbi:GNAT family N-acetyltransferase [Photobacterium nomapromontoriensis]|uniref:GNAT family N-acetyltransferase n=1 Tax=Photobacterium nomapromontoriensis TaxID=2910237 RepID=UPI003D13648F
MKFQDLQQGQAMALAPNISFTLIRESDMADIIQMLANPKVTEYLFFAPAPVEVYRSYFDPIIEATAVAIDEQRWPENPTVVVRDQAGHFMGMGGLVQVMLLEGNFEVGYQLPEHAWGQGIATAICQVLTELAFTVLSAHKVTADCYSSNVGSYKTLEKCGYSVEGQSTHYYKLENGFADRLYLGLTVSEFQNKQQKVINGTFKQ